jgi:hypothetical protein
MSERTDAHPRRRRPSASALASLVVGVGLIASGMITAALTALPVSAQAASCDSVSPVTVRYETALGSFPGSPAAVAVSGVILSAFPAACNGAAVTLEMHGNSAGDPSLPSTMLLSTANSNLQPCGQTVLSTPVVVTNGSITLSLCPTGGPARYASVHDLTRLTLLTSAPNPTGQVKGASTTSSPSPSTSPGKHQGALGASTGTVTPTTGAQLPLPLSWILIAVGMGLVLAGVWVWRPRRYAGPV